MSVHEEFLYRDRFLMAQHIYVYWLTGSVSIRFCFPVGPKQKILVFPETQQIFSSPEPKAPGELIV